MFLDAFSYVNVRVGDKPVTYQESATSSGVVGGHQVSSLMDKLLHLVPPTSRNEKAQRLMTLFLRSFICF